MKSINAFAGIERFGPADRVRFVLERTGLA